MNDRRQQHRSAASESPCNTSAGWNRKQTGGTKVDHNPSRIAVKGRQHRLAPRNGRRKKRRRRQRGGRDHRSIA